MTYIHVFLLFKKAFLHIRKKKSIEKKRLFSVWEKKRSFAFIVRMTRFSEAFPVVYLAFGWLLLVPITILLIDSYRDAKCFDVAQTNLTSVCASLLRCRYDAPDWRVVTIFMLVTLTVQNIAFTIIYERRLRAGLMLFAPVMTPSVPPVAYPQPGPPPYT